MPVALSHGALFISNEDVIGVSSMDAYIEVAEKAYANYSLKKTRHLPRQNFWFQAEDAPQKSFKLLAAATPVDDVCGAYVYSGGYRGQRGWQKCFLLYNFTSGNLAAVIECDHLSKLKTGAVSAAAAKHLARPDAHRVGVFGAGRQAVTQLQGICRVRPVDSVLVYARTESSRTEFCRKMAQGLGVKVEPAANPRQLVEASDIIVTATTSSVPVFEGAWLKEGTHVIAIGAHYPEKRELDEPTVRGSKIVVDTLESAEECGEFTLAGIRQEDLYAEFGEIAAGIKPGRENPAEITVFKSGGRGIEYLALADYVYRQVKKAQPD